MSDYMIWGAAEGKETPLLDELHGVDRQFELTEGIPRLANWPQDAYFSIDEDFADDTTETDNYLNKDFLIVISERLKEFLEKENLKNVEFLPVGIQGRDNQKIGGKCFILHPIHHTEDLDMDASGAEFGIIDPDQVESVDQIVLLDSADTTRQVFRPKPLLMVILAATSLVEKMETFGAKGCQWHKLDEFDAVSIF